MPLSLPKHRSTRWLLLFSALWVPTALAYQLIDFDLHEHFDRTTSLVEMGAFLLLLLPVLLAGLVTAFLRGFRPANLGMVGLLCATQVFLLSNDGISIWSYHWRHKQHWEEVVAARSLVQLETDTQRVDYQPQVFRAFSESFNRDCSFVHDPSSRLVPSDSGAYARPPNQPSGMPDFHYCRRVEGAWIFCCNYW